jgi:hypothetical protein
VSTYSYGADALPRFAFWRQAFEQNFACAMPLNLFWHSLHKCQLRFLNAAKAAPTAALDILASLLPTRHLGKERGELLADVGVDLRRGGVTLLRPLKLLDLFKHFFGGGFAEFHGVLLSDHEPMVTQLRSRVNAYFSPLQTGRCCGATLPYATHSDG